MKKLAVFLLAMLLLTSCAGTPASQNSQEQDYLFVTFDRTTSLEGMYYYTSSPKVLNYVDFDTCNHAVVCPLPNCPHTDPENCYALGVGNGTSAVITIGDSIYWTRIEDDDKTYLYTAQKDGTNRKREAELPKRTSGDKLVYCQNKLYFVGEDSPFDENGGFAEKTSCYLMYYDFDSKEAMECVNMSELYPQINKMHASIQGFFNGKIYISAMGDNAATTYFTYDLSGGDVEKIDFKPMQFEGGYMILSGPILVSPDGTELKFEAPDNGLYGYRVVGDKFFTRAYVYDISTGKRYKNLMTDVFYGPILYKDGKFLIHYRDECIFKWVDEKKVIGAEVE